MIIAAFTLGFGVGVGYMMLINEMVAKRTYQRMVRRFEESGRLPPPISPDDQDDPDISDQDHDIQIRAW